MFRVVDSKSFYKSMIALAAFAAAAGLTSGVRAASISDGNSTVTIDPNGGTPPFITNWVVDGVDQYGGSPAGSESLTFATGTSVLKVFSPINSLSLTSSSFSNGIGSTTYEGDGFTVAIKEIVTGGNSGSGASAINEVISISNTGTTVPVVNEAQPADVSILAFQFRELVNLNVNATPNNDTLTLSPGSGTNTADQTDPAGAHVNFVSSTTPNSLVTIDVPSGTIGSGLGPVTGDESFLAEWDLNIDQGDTAIISNNFTLAGGSAVPVVPLPNSASSALATLAGLGIFGLVRRMRKAAI